MGTVENIDFVHRAPRDVQDRAGRILVRSNILIDPWNARVDDINIVDIARGLACETRYAGHSNAGFYSVAQHSVLVSRMTPPLSREHKLAGLLHDAEEAYLKDIPSPIKSRPEMRAYAEAGNRLRRVIFEAFGLDHDELMPVVHPVDEALYFLERASFANQPLPPGYQRIRPVSWQTAEQQFLSEFERLKA